MSIPRKFSLGHHNINYVTKILYLNQEPVLEHYFFKNLDDFSPIKLEDYSENIIQTIYDAKGKSWNS